MTNFLLYLALNFLSAWLAPKPKQQGPQRYNLSDFSYPTADETRALPLGFGTFKVAGNLVWLGDYAYEKVRKKIRSFPTREYQPLGYKYKIGQWLTLCAAPGDELLEVRLGERVIWSGVKVLAKDATTDVAVNASWTTNEGQEISEGMAGTFRFFNHKAEPGAAGFAPLVNSYMEARLGAGNVPAYPNILHVVWLGPSDGGKGFCSISNNLDALTFVLRRKPDISAALNSSQTISYPVAGSLADPAIRAQVQAWCDERALIEGDANPELVKLELLTSRVPGLGPRLSGDAIDLEASFRAVAASHAEGLGCSFAWESSSPVSELIADLDQLQNSFTELDDATGRLRTKLARPTDVPAYTFDAENIIEISSFGRPSVHTSPNEIVVPYVDRSMNWTQREQAAQSEAGIKAAGTVVSKKIEYRGVSRSNLASILATRALASNSASVIKAAWSAFIEVDGYAPKPGDLVLLNHPKHGPKRMRLDSVRFAEFNDRLSVQLEAVEDVFRTGDASLAFSVPASQLSFSTGVTPNTTPGTQLVLIAPKALSGDVADHMLYAASPSNANQLALDIGWASTNSTAVPADLEYAPGGPTYFTAVEGTLTQAVEWSAAGSIGITLTAANAEALNRLLGQFASGVYAVIWAAGAGSMLPVRHHEFVLITTATITSSTTASLTLGGRGLFDTWPQAWAAGARIVLLTGYAIDPVPLTTSLTEDIYSSAVKATAAGETFSRVWAKFRNGSKVAWDSFGVSIPANYQNDARAMRPASPANIRVNNTLGGVVKAGVIPTVSAVDSKFVLTWVNRGTGTSGADWFTSAAEETTENMRIEYRAWYTSSTVLDGSEAWTQFAEGDVPAAQKSVQIGAAGSSSVSPGKTIRFVVSCYRTIDGVKIYPATDPSELSAQSLNPGRHFYLKIV